MFLRNEKTFFRIEIINEANGDNPGAKMTSQNLRVFVQISSELAALF